MEPAPSCRHRSCRSRHPFWKPTSVEVILYAAIAMVIVVGTVSCRYDDDHYGYSAAFYRQNDLSYDERPRYRLEQRPSSQADQGYDYTFSILQIADIHLGEASWTDWGPEQDRKTWLALDKLLTNDNEQPDLIVFSGDQLTANNVDENATAYYEWLGRKINYYGIPWAVIFGNHDDAPFEDPNTIVVNGSVPYNYEPAKTSRRQLVEVLQQFDLSLTQIGPDHLFGVSNYWLNIYRPSSNQVVAKIVLLDSGGGSLPQRIDVNQTAWFWDTQRKFADTPILAFQHIPSSVEEFGFDANRCRGLAEDGVAPLDQDAGIVSALLAAGNVHFLAVGHNHGNDYCCRQSPILHLCFGRHSGYGGYGRWDRGARVYQLNFDVYGTFAGWKSHVLMESGEIRDEYIPNSSSII
jgi:Calcineurin-like phosphoesterase